MRLSQLIADLPWATFNRDAEVSRAVVDSRQVRPGDLFVAIPGARLDGSSFVPAAISAGAAAIVAEDDLHLDQTPQVRVPNARRFAGLAAHRLAGDPTANMTVVGITGTNGKTTVTYLLEEVFKAEGREVGVIGTVNYRYNATVTPAKFTTPEAPELVEIILKMKKASVNTVVMEVSSHALELERVIGCLFDAAVFTNLSRDHLDFHGELDAYLAAKIRLFDELLPVAARKKPHTFGAVNLDDPAGVRVLQATPVRALAYGAGQPISWIRHTCDFDGLRGTLRYGDQEVEVTCPLLGDFQAFNILAAAAVCHGLHVPPAALVAGLSRCHRVPGRLDRVGKQDFLVLVDYAHTPDALENVLSTLRRLSKGRIITVFGCGGDRDKGKRPLMGKAVAERADLAIITSDNPRTENPQTIINMILPGVIATGRKRLSPEEILEHQGPPVYTTQPDREAAIDLAVRAARPGDVVLIAGKGHEDYQIIGTERIHFDDREKATAALAKKFGN